MPLAGGNCLEHLELLRSDRAYLDALGSRETRKALGDAEQKRQEAQEALRLLPAAQNRACPPFLPSNASELT